MKLLSADLILPITHPPRKDSAIVIKAGKIAELGSRKNLKKKFPQAEEFHFPLLMPGLVNAHTHLELSGLKRLSAAGGFTDWIIRLVREKRKWDSARYARAAQKEIKNQLRLGITSLGDVLSDPVMLEVHHQSPLFSTAFYELIEIREQGRKLKMELMKTHLAEFNFALGRTKPGLSPHTPYTVSRALFQEARKFAVAHELGLCTHLAESEDELELIQSGSGPIATRLYSQELLMDIKFKPASCSPAQYLADLIDRNMTLIHCVEITDSDLEIIAKARAVVHCPRSNLHISGKLAPIPKMIDAGIPVALGTDSPASAGDTNLWNELKKVYQLRKEYPGREIKPSEILKMATINSSRAIFRDTEFGSIEKGKLANLIGFQPGKLSDNDDQSASAIINAGAAGIQAVFLNGELQKF